MQKCNSAKGFPITHALRNGNLSANPLMDSLRYFYKSGTNQLDYIRDKNSGSTAHSSNYGATVDIKDQAAGNYVYNAIGELNYDRISSIDSVKWNVYGKMQHIYKHSATYGTQANGLHYYYDPSGNRTGMAVLYNPSSYNEYTWYVRDAQGNVMAVYRANGANLATITLKLREHYIYGSSRLGVINRNMDVDQPRLTPDNGNANLGTAYLATFTRGDKLFEFTNHLGNVLFTATDGKVPKAQTGNPSLVGSYSVNMVTAVDYTPFGMIMQGMNYGSAAPGKYRYGFNGKEWDNSTKGNADQIDYGERPYDNRGVRFGAPDPLTKSYPELSPYQFASNSPIENSDLDGRESISNTQHGLARQREAQMQMKTALQNAYEQKIRHFTNPSNFPQVPPPPYLRPSPNFSPTEKSNLEVLFNINLQNEGYNYDLTKKPGTKLLDNKTYQNFSNNIALPTLDIVTLFDGASLAKGLWKGLKSISIPRGVSEVNFIREFFSIGKGRNVAVLEGQVGNTKIADIAVSGQANREGLIGNPSDRFFSTQEVGGYDRLFDAEVKLLENVAQRYKLTPNIEGSLKLTSEKKYCKSCIGVIEQFKKKFPNIKIQEVNGVK